MCCSFVGLKNKSLETYYLTQIQSKCETVFNFAKINIWMNFEVVTWTAFFDNILQILSLDCNNCKISYA